MIEWAVTSSALILTVLTVRRLLLGRLSLRLQYGLWALVLARLLLPVNFGETAWSVLNLTGPVQYGEERARGSQAAAQVTPELSIVEPDDALGPQLSMAEPGADFTSELPQIEAAAAAGAGEGGPAVGRVLAGLWVAGAVGLGLWLSWVNVGFARRLRRCRRPLEVPDCPLPVYVTGAAQTPCFFGLLCPCVYVTEEVAADETVLRHSLVHELTHFRHGDHVWSALRGLCLALHWYNPLVWLAAALSRRDGELCCDEATVKRLGEGERAAYGRTLLAVTCQGRGNPLLTATSMTGSGKDIKERILLLAKRPKTAAYTMAAVALIAAIAVGCTFTGAEGEEDFVPDRVTMEQPLSSSLPPEPVTDPETVARLWELYQSFTFEGTAQGLDRDNVWSVTVRFSWEDSQQTEGFTIFQGGLCTLGEDYGTYHILRDGAELYQEVQTVFDRQAELGGEDEGSGTVVAHADLDRDGEEETIEVAQADPQIWQLVVTKADGTELFREEAGTPHVGWNSLYLCQDSQGGDCLLRYNPYVSTGLASYTYTLFTLEGGTQTVIQAGSLDLELRQAPERLEELVAFAGEVNALLKRGALLLSTQDGELAVGPEPVGAHLERLNMLASFGERENTVFTYGGRTYDLSERNGSITTITNCTLVGQYLVFEGHTGQENNVYCIFDTDAESFKPDLAGANLIFRGDDLSTGVYSFRSDVYAYDGTLLASCDLKEEEFICGLAYSRDFSQVIVSIADSAYELRAQRFDLAA